MSMVMQSAPSAEAAPSVRQRAPLFRLHRASVWIWCLTLAGISLIAVSIPAVSAGVSFWFYLFQWIALASALNLMAGMTGYVPFGFAAFFGIGAYAAAVLSQFHHAPTWAALVGATAAGALLAVLFAPTLRLRGVFFSVVSLSLAIVLRSVIVLLPEDVAGGSSGITITGRHDPILLYYLMVAVSMGAVAIATAISVTPHGLRLKAIGDDLDAAQIIGVNAKGLRLAMWMLSGTIAAVCGALEGLYSSAIDPAAAFNILISTKAIIYAALGGLGTVMGPVVGAVLMTITDELIWARFPIANLFILGLIVAATVLFFPRGIVGSLLQRHPRFRRWFF